MWGDTFVEEGNLTQYISHLRTALDDNSEDPRLIATIARKGYQFNDFVLESKFHVVCLSWESDSTSSQKVSAAKYMARGIGCALVNSGKGNRRTT